MGWAKTAEICPLCGDVITDNYVLNNGRKVHESCVKLQVATPELIGTPLAGKKASEYMDKYKRPKVDEAKLKGVENVVVEKKTNNDRKADSQPRKRGRPTKK